MSTAPTSSHLFLSAFNHSGSTTKIPPSPWIGSTITPHVSSVTKLSSPAKSLTFPTSNPGTIGANGFWYLALFVALKLPIERPWKPFSKHANRYFLNSPLPSASSQLFPVLAAQRSLPTFLANLIAPSLASVPEFAKNTFAPFGAREGSARSSGAIPRGGSDPEAQPSPPSRCVRVTSNSASEVAHGL